MTFPSVRCRQPEAMDQPGLSEQEHVRALAALARLNWISRSNRILWPLLARIAQQQPSRALRVLDLACGSGDVTAKLAARARRQGYVMAFAGCDKSEVALSVARKSAAALKQDIEFFQADVLTTELPNGYDVVMCSLFLHHLDDSDAEGLLRRMGRAAGRLVLVHDLVRCVPGYGLAFLASRLLTRSPIVHRDALVSVQQAFTPAEAIALAARAGLRGATATGHWPLRFLLQCWKA